MLLARSICWRQRDRDVVKLRSWICPQIKFTVRRISSELKSCRHGGIMMIPNSKNGIPETFSIDELKRSLFGAFKVSADIEMRDYERYFGMPTLARRSGDDRRRSSLHLSDGTGELSNDSLRHSGPRLAAPSLLSHRTPRHWPSAIKDWQKSFGGIPSSERESSYRQLTSDFGFNVSTWYVLRPRASVTFHFRRVNPSS
jgi:hypothetical protein